VTTATLETSEPTAELLPGYHVEPETGAWLTLPWPGDPSLPWDDPGRLELLPPSLGFDAIRWCAGIATAGMPGVERSSADRAADALGASSEGDPATAIFLNESHHMTESSGGQAVAGVARRNVAKSPGGSARLLEFTNAHLPGRRVRRRGLVRSVAAAGVRADPPGRHPVRLVRGAAASAAARRGGARGGHPRRVRATSPWTDEERIRDEAQDPRVPVADSVGTTSTLCRRTRRRGSSPASSMRWPDRSSSSPTVSRSRCSWTARSPRTRRRCPRCRISDGHVLTFGCWQRPHGDRGHGWLAPREDVDAEVRAAFEQFDVQWFGVDPSPARDDETEAQYWAALVDEWHRDFREEVLLWATPGQQYGHAVLFDMRLSAHGGRERNRLFTEAASRPRRTSTSSARCRGTATRGCGCTCTTPAGGRTSGACRSASSRVTRRSSSTWR
jgi:hypothetical protein